MKLTVHSRNRLLETFQKWNVPKEFADPMYNYLVYGYSPGSCFTAVLANDFHDAISRSHPANTVEAFKLLSGWIQDCMPREAHGSYDVVADWLTYDSDVRRSILENKMLVYKTEQEVWMTLQNVSTTEPTLY
jgi:hypothetical protein